MSRTTQALVGFLFVALSGCAGANRGHVDPRVAAQVTVAKDNPPPGCAYLGPVSGSTMVGELSDAHGDVIRNAVLQGGNFVSVDMVERPAVVGVGGFTVRGRLFTCPGRGPTPIQAIAQVAALDSAHAAAGSDADHVTLPKAICEPECSPGFACLHGACVTACNPGCGSGEQCGSDRACHASR